MNFLRATGTACMASAQVVCKNGAASAFARLTVEGHRGSFAVEWVVTALYGRATVREQHNQHQTELVGTSDRHNFSSFHTKPCLLTPPCTKIELPRKGGVPMAVLRMRERRLMGVGLVTMCARARARGGFEDDFTTKKEDQRSSDIFTTKLPASNARADWLFYT